MPADYVKYKAKEQEVSPIKPALTFLMVFFCVWAFSDLQSHSVWGLKNTAFGAGKFMYQLEHGEYQKMLEMMFHATFAQANWWSMLFSSYFLWVFGSTVETRLGQVRYLAVVAASMLGGWYILGLNVCTTSKFLWIGPGLLTCGLIGAYLCFYPEKKMNAVGSLKYTHQIFKNDPTPNPAETFGVAPWKIILAFFLYQGVLHFVLNKMKPGFDNLNFVAAVGALVIGMVASGLIISLSTMGTEGNPLKRLTVKKYRELRALDMDHEEALFGTSRLLSIPPEQVKAWVSQGSAALPESHS